MAVIKRKQLRQFTTQQLFQILEYQLNQDVIGQNHVITLILSTLISGHPCALYGLPGIGKTFAIELVAKACGVSSFYYLHNQFTKPAEIEGAPDVVALRERGEYIIRTEGKAPASEIVMADELGKASTAIQNKYLRLTNEKRGPNGEKSPLLAFYAMSNEKFDSPALNDRFTVKAWVEQPTEEETFVEFMKRQTQPGYYESKVTKRLLSRGHIQEARKLSQDDVVFPESMIGHLWSICEKIKEKLNEAPSFRRIGQAPDVLKAIAWLRGQQEVSLNLVREFLPNLLWNDPDKRGDMEDIIHNYVDNLLKVLTNARNVGQEALKSFNETINAEISVTIDQAEQAAINAITDINKHIDIINESKLIDAFPVETKEALGTLKGWIAEIGNSLQSFQSNKVREEVEAVVRSHVKTVHELIHSTSTEPVRIWNERAVWEGEALGDDIDKLEAMKNPIAEEGADKLRALLNEVYKQLKSQSQANV